jgi:hypothetical protein
MVKMIQIHAAAKNQASAWFSSIFMGRNLSSLTFNQKTIKEKAGQAGFLFKSLKGGAHQNDMLGWKGGKGGVRIGCEQWPPLAMRGWGGGGGYSLAKQATTCSLPLFSPFLPLSPSISLSPIFWLAVRLSLDKKLNREDPNSNLSKKYEWVKFPGKIKKRGVIIPDDNITW